LHRLIILVFYKYKFVAFHFAVALVITEVIIAARFCCINICIIFKIETLFFQHTFNCCGFFFWIQRFQNGVICFQDAIDFAHEIGGAAQLFIVVRVAAKVVAKFLVGTPAQWFAAIEAGSVVHV
jgi:hypothetical protein